MPKLTHLKLGCAGLNVFKSETMSELGKSISAMKELGVLSIDFYSTKLDEDCLEELFLCF